MIRPTSDRATIKSVVEALIFASEEPLSSVMIARILNGDRDESESVARSLDALMPDEPESNGHGKKNGVSQTSDDPGETPEELAGAMIKAASRGGRRTRSFEPKLIASIVDDLNADYEETRRAFRIREVAGGYQFATLADFGEYVSLLSRDKARRRLSAAALETLAIIAYRQPVSKPEIEAIRGVNCDQVLVNLMEKNLVAITGRSEGVGRPLLYGTTEEFLRTFGLKGLGDLPKLRELEELMEDDAFQAERAEVVTISVESDVEEIEAQVGRAGETKRESDSADIEQTIHPDAEEERDETPDPATTTKRSKK